MALVPQQPVGRALARAAALLACIAASSTAIGSPPAPTRRVAMPNLPITFERNTGHWPKEVQFVARSGGGTLFLTKKDAVLALRRGDKATALRLKLQGLTQLQSHPASTGSPASSTTSSARTRRSGRPTCPPTPA